jgi:hypothetical protein
MDFRRRKADAATSRDTKADTARHRACGRSRYPGCMAHRIAISESQYYRDRAQPRGVDGDADALLGRSNKLQRLPYRAGIPRNDRLLIVSSQRLCRKRLFERPGVIQPFRPWRMKLHPDSCRGAGRNITPACAALWCASSQRVYPIVGVAHSYRFSSWASKTRWA